MQKAEAQCTSGDLRFEYRPAYRLADAILMAAALNKMWHNVAALVLCVGWVTLQRLEIIFEDANENQGSSSI